MAVRKSAYAPVLVGALGLVLLVLAAAYQVYRDYGQVGEELTMAARAHAELVGSHVDRTTEAAMLLLDQVARRHAMADWADLQTSRTAQQGLAESARLLPQIRSIWLVDQNGHMRLFSDRFPTPGLDVFEREYYQAHAQGTPRRMFYGQTRKGAFTGRDYLAVSYPIVAARYNFTGVVAAAMEPAYYHPIISTFSERCRTCRVMLLRDNGDLLLQTDPVEGVSEPAPTDALQAALATSAAPFTDRIGGAWTAVAARSQEAPMTAAVLLPDSAIRAAWWQRDWPTILAVAVAAVLIGALLLRSLLAARHLADSHDRLTEYAREVEQAKAEETRLRQMAAAANDAKSRFLAMMSHELRTPLNSVLGFAELIGRGRQDPRMKERAPDYAEDIVSSGRHLLSLLNDILDLSRIEAGRFELQEEAFELDDAVQAAVRLVGPKAAAAGVAIDAPHNGVALVADQRAIRQMLVNLLGNAAKFTQEGRITVTAETGDDGVTLSVADTGVGMDEAGLERALQPFGQADDGYRRPTHGTGLGLNIVRELARLHGGDMDVASTLGKGTTVIVTLPRERVVGEPAAAEAAE